MIHPWQQNSSHLPGGTGSRLEKMIMPTTNTQLLNAVQKQISKFSNEQGISLASEFKSVDDFKRFVVSLSMQMLIDAGKTVQEAYDIVLGEGSWRQLSDDVWSHFEAQRAA